MSDGTPVRVLHVDDDPELIALAAEFLDREDGRIEVAPATSASQGLEEIDDGEVDCVVSDYDMPGRDGIAFLEAVREEHPDLPFILFTGKGSEEVASRAISAGVTDYLQKGGGASQYAVLANRIANAVEKHRAEREAERTRARLQAVAENTNDAIVIIDEGSTIRFANPAVEDLFGHSPADLEGESLTALMPERHRDAHADAVGRYLETGERTTDWRSVEFPGRHADGREIPLSISFGEFEQGGRRRFVGVLRDISEQARMEAELREREERFRQLAENLREVVWMSDPGKEEMLYVNPAYEDLWGRRVEHLYADPTSFLDAVHPEDRDRVEAAVERQAEGGYDEEYRVVHPDGEVRWVRDRAVPVRNDAGEVYRIIGIASDVTGRKEHERELERHRDRFEHLQRFAGVGYWELDPRSDPPYDVTLTEELYRIHAVPPDEEFDLETGLEFYHPADRPALEAAVERAIQDGEPYDIEARLIAADGERRWVHTVCEPIEEDGEVVLLRGALQDITGRKERENERQRIIDRVTDAIVQVDSDWRFTFVDERAEEIYGMDAADLLGRDFWAVFSDALGTRFEEEYRRAMRTREPTSFEEHFDGLDGWFQVNAYPDDGGGLSFYFREVTERKERERELEQHRARLQEFTSIVSHDLRNPLNVAEGRLEMAREECDSDSLVHVANAHDRIRTLIDDLLALARANESLAEPEPVDLRELAVSCWGNVETRGASLRVETDRVIVADESRLGQLLENLIRNAVEHGGDGVTIAVGDIDGGFYVEDDGAGIPEAERERVFESGYSTSERGTGFGLAIVATVAEAHGWDVTVREGEEGGTRFEIAGVEPA